MAGLNLALQALSVPAGTEFPGTVQGLMNFIAAYQQITGQSNFSGVNFGSTEPAAEDRDKPWFKTDDSGNPVGWYAWDGSAWEAMPLVTPSGATESRPLSPQQGQKFYDTTIGAELIYIGSAWITSSGSPGDIKPVVAATLEDALDKNPGWSNYTAGVGNVIAGANEDTYGLTDGSASVTLSVANLPNDTINLLNGWGVFPGQFQNGSQSPGVNPIVTGVTTKTTGPMNPNTQEAFSVIQPTIYLWLLIKDDPSA